MPGPVARGGLKEGSLRIERDTDDNDGQSLFLYYPNVAVDVTGYVKPRVLIESGAKSAVDPHVVLPISRTYRTSCRTWT